MHVAMRLVYFGLDASVNIPKVLCLFAATEEELKAAAEAAEAAAEAERKEAEAKKEAERKEAEAKKTQGKSRENTEVRNTYTQGGLRLVCLVLSENNSCFPCLGRKKLTPKNPSSRVARHDQTVLCRLR